jgi:hypothetical protein
LCKKRQLTESEAPRPQARASLKGNVALIVPLDPAYKAGLAGHLPAKDKDLTSEAKTYQQHKNNVIQNKTYEENIHTR